MIRGDKWNWACAVFAIVLLYMGCFVAFVPQSAAPDKYYHAMFMYASGFHAAVLSLALTGALSLITRNSTPILGALLGLVGVFALGATALIAFVALVFVAYWIAPHASGRPIALAWSAVVMAFPVVALAMAFLRNPKMESSNKTPRHVPSKAAADGGL